MQRHRVKPGSRVELARRDAGSTAGFRGGKKRAAAELARLNERLEALQELLWAEHRHKVLVVLQGMDTSGKDGTIRHVFEGVNPPACGWPPSRRRRRRSWTTTSSGASTPRCPGAARSSSSTAATTRTCWSCGCSELVPRAGLEAALRADQRLREAPRRHRHHDPQVLPPHRRATSRSERLQARLDDPTKRWKFRRGDLEDAQALGGLHGSLRGRPLAHQHRLRALVRRAGQQEVVPQPGGGHRPRRGAGRSRDDLSARPARPRWTGAGVGGERGWARSRSGRSPA